MPFVLQREKRQRSLSALFDIASIALTFFLAKRFIGQKGALIASFLYSISLSLIYASQDARPYSLHVLLALASAYMLIKALDNNKNSNWVGFVAAAIIGLYNHFLFVLFVGAMAAYVLLRFKEYINKPVILKKMIFSFVIIGIAFSPLLYRAFHQNDAGWLGRPSLPMAAKFIMNLNTGLYPSARLIEDIYKFNIYSFTLNDWILLSSVFFTTALFSVIFFYSTYSFFKRFIRTKKGIQINPVNDMSFFIIWLLIPILSAVLYSIFTTNVPIFGPINYLLYCIPPYLILVSSYLSKIKYQKYFIVLILILSVAPIYAYYSNPVKHQWREAADFMRERSSKGDVILLNIYTGQVAFKYYYGISDNIFGVRNAAEALNLAGNKDSIWLILASTKYSDPKGKIKKALDENYKLSEEKHFFEVYVYHYKKGS